MISRRAASLSLLVLTLITVVSAAPLPSGHSGIAARYPFDVGIAADPAVIFADNFESYTSAAGLTNRWNEAYHSANIRLQRDRIEPQRKHHLGPLLLSGRPRRWIQLARKLYDNVVAATSYSGPMAMPPLTAPTGFRILR